MRDAKADKFAKYKAEVKTKSEKDQAEFDLSNAEKMLEGVSEELAKAGGNASPGKGGLQPAVELGERFLGKGDALFSRRVLTGEVPKADWKKLNRKATFKMTYKARAFKIQNVLAKMLGTFKTNLKDAADKEQEAQAQYNELSGSKRERFEEAQQALSKTDSRSRSLLNFFCKQVRRSSSLWHRC